MYLSAFANFTVHILLFFQLDFLSRVLVYHSFFVKIHINYTLKNIKTCCIKTVFSISLFMNVFFNDFIAGSV